MNDRLIIHVSEVDIFSKTGMGRVEFYWKKSFEQSDTTFLHIGPKEVGPLKHRALFPYYAFKYYKKLNLNPRALVVHEPLSGPFTQGKVPCFLESHGVERRSWEVALSNPALSNTLSLKSKLIYPLWRLSVCDKGLRNAFKLLLINRDDKEFVKLKYNRSDEDIFLFKNGVNNYNFMLENSQNKFTVLFNGSWIKRKGIDILVKAAEILFNQGVIVHYLLIGTGKEEKFVLNDWPEKLRPFVTVISQFAQEDEINYLKLSSLFVLPSYFEGQPLSLLQAMAANKCCITTNCCGQKDIIKNGETGILFEPGDFNALAFQIKRCLEDQNLVNEIGSKAKNYVEGLSWEKVSKDLTDYVLSNS